MNDESPIDTSPDVTAVIQEEVATPEPEASTETPSRTTREAMSKALDGIEFANDPKSAPEKKDPEKSSEEGTGGEETPEVRGDTTDNLPAPNRFSKAAKAAWETTDPVIKAEFSRAIQELETGLTRKLEKFKPIEEFITLADQQKVDPAQTLRGYVEMEQLLYDNPKQGFTLLGQKMGLSVPQLIQMLGGSEQQAAGGNANPKPDQRDQVIMQLQQELSEMRNEVKSVNSIVREQSLAQTQTVIEQFAKDHPRLDELSDEIARQIEQGFDLKQAYERAERLNPAPAQTEIAVSAHTRTRKSVTGTSKGGSNPTTMTSKSSREALERAFNSLGT